MFGFKSGRTRDHGVVFGPVSDKSSLDGPSDSDSLLSEQEVQALRRKRPLLQRWRVLIVLHLLIAAIYGGVLFAVVNHYRTLVRRGPQLVFSPANEAIEWEEVRFVENSQEHGPFSGYPRPEIDQNWHDLLNAENIYIEPEVMRHYGREDLGVAIPDGDGYIGTLNVYHELHCIKRLWQYSYPEVYWKDLTPEQAEVNRLHNEHCFDFLRQAAMCHADVGIITYQWSLDGLIPQANATTHQCANWKKLDEWTKARTVDMMKPGWLIHPTKGPAYPDGQGSRLGAEKGQPHLVGHEGHASHE